jgi:hypothetical protein
MYIDLWQRFGDRFRLTFDEVATVGGRNGDPWLMQIPCRLGTIYPHGGEILALEIDYHDFTAARLRRAGLVLAQDGDRERPCSSMWIASRRWLPLFNPRGADG